MNLRRWHFLSLLICCGAIALTTSSLAAQQAAVVQMSPTDPGAINNPNPLTVLQDVANAIPGTDGRLSAVLNIMLLLTVLEQLAP